MTTATTRELRSKSTRHRLVAQKSVAPGGKVAQAAAPAAPAKPQRRFDAKAHVKWLREVWGDEKPVTDSGRWLAAARADRVLAGKR